MTNAHVAYKKEVAELVRELLATHKKDDPAFKKQLIATIVKCFHLPGVDQDSMEGAKIILDELFGYSVSDFIHEHVPDTAIAKSLLIELLYGLYYASVDFSLYKPTDFEFLPLQVLAEKTLVTAILDKLTLDKTLRLIEFLFRVPREGTFAILPHLRPDVQELVLGLKRNYFDSDLFTKLVAAESAIDDKAMARIVQKLQEYADWQTKEFYTNFKELVPLMVASLGDIYKGLCQVINDPGQLQTASLQHEELKNAIKPYYARNYSLSDFEQFTRIFGLKHYPCIFVDSFSESTSIVDKSKNLNKIVSGLIGISRSLASLMPQEMQTLLSFVLAIIAHLDVTIQRPQVYKEGLEYFTCCIATCGKELAGQAAVASIIQSYRHLQDFLQRSHGLQIVLKEYPIVIFDQSEYELFSVNNSYLRALENEHNCTLVHVSKDQAAYLAKRLGFEKLLRTKPDGSFGFGGGRNCQYLLTGVIRAAYKAGSRTFEEVLAIPVDILKGYFTEAVLGSGHKNMLGDAIFMVDDDMQVSDVAIFTCALYAKIRPKEPYACVGYQLGRASKYNLFYWDLKEYLAAPEATTMFPLWINYHTLTGVSEHFVRPKLCLNLPQGNEENHYLSLARGHSFLQPSYHLCGSRYPNREIPTHFFVGLDQHFEKATSYVLFLYLTDYLIAPKSQHTPTVLPWNDNQLSSRFINLHQGMAFIAAEQTKIELQARFWLKVADLFCRQKQEFKPFLQVIQAILSMDVDAIAAGFQASCELSSLEKASLQKLCAVYKANQEDMQLFWQFGKELGQAKQPAIELEAIRQQIEQASGKNMSEYPITEGLYLMACSLGRGEFSQIAKNAVFV